MHFWQGPCRGPCLLAAQCNITNNAFEQSVCASEISDLCKKKEKNPMLVVEREREKERKKTKKRD